MTQTPHSKFRHVYAIVRIDESAEPDVPLEEKINITKVPWTEQDADLEVERLTHLNASRGCRYVWLLTRLPDEPETD